MSLVQCPNGDKNVEKKYVSLNVRNDWIVYTVD